MINACGCMMLYVGCCFPQQRKLTGSSAQISSGVRRCGSQAQVPEGSGGFHKVPVCAGVAASGVCGGSGRFRRVKGQAQVLEGFASNNAPMCRFEIEKANAHDTAMYALLLLGIPPKLIFCCKHSTVILDLLYPLIYRNTTVVICCIMIIHTSTYFFCFPDTVMQYMYLCLSTLYIYPHHA